MYVDKPDPVVNLSPVRFTGGITNQKRTGKTKGYWEPEISAAVITTVVVPVEEAFTEIIINSRRSVIYL